VVINAQPLTPSAPLVGTITQPNCSTSTGSVILNGLPASGTWTINPGNISGSGIADTISGLSAGTYSYTVTNADGCSSLASANVIINAQPLTPIINSAASIDSAYCGNATGAIKNINITGGSTPYTYQWYSNNTLVSNDSVLNNAIPGNYILIVQSQQGCKDTSIVFNIPSVNGINVSLSAEPLSGIEPLNSNVFANTTTPATDYKWELNDNIISNETDSILNLSQLVEGTYVTEVIVTDKNNCKDTAKITIVVDGIVSIYIPNVFTPNLDGYNDLFIITQKGYKDLDLKIYNRWGLLIWEINALMPLWDGRTSAGGLATEGTYFYILKTTDKKDEVKTYTGSFLLTR
jgi:gliding motility-associated-like protein